MALRKSPLNYLQVASPCSAAWEQMEGDNRVRFCDACGLNVYNLSAMTALEAERLVLKKEGRLCARFFQREDGTVLTQDCPRGLAAARRAAARVPLFIGAAVAGMFLLLFGLLGTAAGLSFVGRGNSGSGAPFKAINGWMNGTPGNPPREVVGDICPVDPDDPPPPPQ
jgi:hypothetical protein